MEYNSQKDLLIIPEYGRNMQELIRHSLTIESKEERQSYVEHIIDLMQQMYPQSRNVVDSKLKLWQHVIRIAEQDLEVEYPEGLSPEVVDKRPDVVAYPEEINRFRHYGKHVRTMIAKAIEMEDGPIKEGFVRTIAGYMKTAYRNWHKELNVSDDVIKSDLASISKGALQMDADEAIETNTNNNYRKRSHGRNYGSNNRGGGRRNNHSNGRNNGRNNNGRSNNKRRY